MKTMKALNNWFGLSQSYLVGLKIFASALNNESKPFLPFIEELRIYIFNAFDEMADFLDQSENVNDSIRLARILYYWGLVFKNTKNEKSELLLTDAQNRFAILIHQGIRETSVIREAAELDHILEPVSSQVPPSKAKEIMSIDELKTLVKTGFKNFQTN